MLFLPFLPFFSQEYSLFLPVPTHFLGFILVYIDVFIHHIYPTFMVLPRVYGFTLPLTLPNTYNLIPYTLPITSSPKTYILKPF